MCIQGESILTNSENNASKCKFSLPKLQFPLSHGNLKERLPFWSQFKQTDKDVDIAPENNLNV